MLCSVPVLVPWWRQSGKAALSSLVPYPEAASLEAGPCFLSYNKNSDISYFSAHLINIAYPLLWKLELLFFFCLETESIEPFQELGCLSQCGSML